jgi:hypothetical protein
VPDGVAHLGWPELRQPEAAAVAVAGGQQVETKLAFLSGSAGRQVAVRCRQEQVRAACGRGLRRAADGRGARCNSSKVISAMASVRQAANSGSAVGRHARNR